MSSLKRKLLDLALENGSLSLELEALQKELEDSKRAYKKEKADNACLKALLQRKQGFEVRG